MTESDANRTGQTRAARLRPLLSMALILLAVLGVAFAVRGVPMDVLGEIRLRIIPWWTFPLIAFLQLLFLLLAADIWRRVVTVTTGTGITLWSSYLQLAVVAIGKYVPGKVWGFVARAGEMYRQRIPVHLSVSSSIVEQVLVLAGAILIAVIAALFALPDYRIATTIIGLLLVIATGIASSRIPGLTRWMMRRNGIDGGAGQIARLRARDIFGIVFSYTVLWLLSGLTFAAIYYSLFDASITLEGVSALTLGNTAGIVLGFFAFFVPGGIGVREAVATFVLSGFVPIREALLAAVCYRGWLVLIDALNALLILGREAAAARREPVRGDERAR